MGFGEYQRDLIDARWLQGPKARAFTKTLGDAKQAALDELKAGVKARYPAGAASDPLRLRKLGGSFGLEQYPAESGEQFEARLSRAFPSHEKAGTAPAIVEQLQAYGIVDVEVIEDWQGHYAEGEWPSRIWGVIGPDFGSLDLRPMILGDTWILGNDWTLGSSATPEQISAIVRIIQKWMDYSSLLVGVIVRWTGAALLGLDVDGDFVLGGGDALVWRVTNPLGDCVLGSWTLGGDLLP